MTSASKNIYNILFILIILVLTVFKWHDFSLPYFWDELGVYSQAADYQYHHGLSLMPASVPPVLSRGHPLFFDYITACAMCISGEQIGAVHGFCFIISVLLLLAVYLKVSRYINPMAGLLSAFILAIQPIFLAQCGLALPEITLALLIFMAICSYYERHLLLFALFASLAILTKEAAIILPAVVFTHSLIERLVYRRTTQTLGIFWFISICIPYIVFLSFLYVQKQQNGWYFFPYHMESVSLNAMEFIQQSKLYASFVFKEQGRYIISIIIAVGLLVGLILGRLRAWSFVLLLLILALFFISLNSFFSIYMARYSIVALVVFAIFGGIFLTTISQEKWVPTLLIGLLLFSSHRHWDDGRFHYDEDMSYRRSVSAVQQALDYATEQIGPTGKIFANFPAYFALTFPEGGYLHGKKIDPTQVSNHGDYCLLLCEPGAPLDFDTVHYSRILIRRFEQGSQMVSVYRVKQKELSL